MRYYKSFYFGEKDIKLMELIAAGLSSAEIGKIVFYSARTVEATVFQLLIDMQVKNRAQLVSKAYHRGFLKI